MVAFMADKQKTPRKPSGTIKKVNSAPNLQPMEEGDDSELSPTDKKRNKLGYHRTAVACGHCRRRKIRCIPSPDPTLARCQNCIRLKKDCHYFPIEQGAAIMSKSKRPDGKGGILATESEASVSSSSPSLQAGVPGADHYGHYRASTDVNAIPRTTEYPPPQYEHRQWYSTDPVPHPYWIQHDHNHQNSFTYPITPTSNEQSATLHSHTYPYPAVSPDHQNYPYPTPSPRNGQIHGQVASLPAFSDYRVNTMHDRVEVPSDAYRAHEMHASSSGQSAPSHLMGSHYQLVQSHTTPYPPLLTPHAWIPASSEPHQSTLYSSNPSPLTTWYNQGDDIKHLKRRSSPQHSTRDEPNRSRAKPG